MTTTTTSTTTLDIRPTIDFRGTWTALITPFRDGGIDDGALRALVDLQIAGGVSGLVACGSTGETTSTRRWSAPSSSRRRVASR